MSAVLDVRDLIGVPFVDLGRDYRTGLDCWGLVMEVHRRMGNEIQDLAVTSCFDTEAAAAQAKRAIEFGLWYRVEVPAFGDVIALETNPNLPGCIDHTGIYIGDGRMLHTIQKHNCVVVRLDDHWYKNKLRGFYRWDAR